MPLPTGQRFELLSPFDPRQEPGRPPRLYPLHLLEPGDWFAVENCTPQQAASIRSSVVNFRRNIYRDRRFTVRFTPEAGHGAVVCARIL
jgi:hypothetical protein